jgi:hypothetical protein
MRTIPIVPSFTAWLGTAVAAFPGGGAEGPEGPQAVGPNKRKAAEASDSAAVAARPVIPDVGELLMESITLLQCSGTGRFAERAVEPGIG